MRLRSPRLFALLSSVILCLPLTVELFQLRQTELSRAEDPRFASWPGFPRSAKAWRALPAAVDGFLSHHFGLRDAAIYLHGTLSYLWLREANPDVLLGRGGRLFYYGNDAIAQSAGVVFRPLVIQHTIDVVSDMHTLLSERGIKFIAAVPPNAASVYDGDLPVWARRKDRDTESHQIIEGLKSRGIPVVDLLPTIRAARDQGSLYYRTDTHWNLLGSLIAYNAIATAAGHPDWTVKADDVLGQPVRFGTGDLVRMLGVGGSQPEMIRTWISNPDPMKPTGPIGDLLLADGVPDGPTVLIIGDSFTKDQFPKFMASHVGRIAWLANQDCGFDWSWIATLRPDEVWWVPTERIMPCKLDTRPKGMADVGESVGGDVAGVDAPR